MAETAMTVAGVDVGGTNIGAGLVSDAHEVLDRAKAATPPTARTLCWMSSPNS